MIFSHVLYQLSYPATGEANNGPDPEHVASGRRLVTDTPA